MLLPGCEWKRENVRVEERYRACVCVCVCVCADWPHPASVEIEGDPLLVAVEDLGKVPVCEEDAPLEEGVGGLASQLLHPAWGAWRHGGIHAREKEHD